MKATTRKTLNEIKTTLTLLKGDVSILMDEEIEYFENMQEDMKDSKEGEAIQDSLDKMLYLRLSMRASIRLIEDIVNEKGENQ